MVGVLAPAALYEFTGGEPPALEQLRSRYERQAVGRSSDGSQGWLNWILRERSSRSAVGYVQSTLERDGPQLVAEVAWVVTPQYQGLGYAVEAASAMLGWLRAQGVTHFRAHIRPDHHASIGVARRLGLHPTAVVVDGETRWEIQH
jgi:RimJ/RimL family protein N-acetyltransferase